MSMEDDFISLDAGADKEDFLRFEDASDDGAEAPDSFDPSEIKLSTFRKLLACYATAVEAVYRDKIIAKLRPKGTKKGKNAAPTVAEKPLDKSEENRLKKEMDAFAKLDEWRYETLPALVKERRDEQKNEGSAFIDKGDLVRLTEWKLAHGHYRPTLVGMVKSNQGATVKKSSIAAFAAVPNDTNPVTAPDEAFPKVSMDKLTQALRGVGPATASLILSAITAECDPEHEAPFYSDEMFLWLAHDVYPSAENGKIPKKASKLKRPNGELKVNYTLPEYRKLYGAAWELSGRLNRAAKKAAHGADDTEQHRVSLRDIEKVAFVLGHIHLAGYFDDDVLAHPSAESNESEDEEEDEDDEEDKKEKAEKKRRKEQAEKVINEKKASLKRRRDEGNYARKKAAKKARSK